MKIFNWLITILLALSLPACDAGTTDNTQEAATTAAKNQELEGEQSFEEEYEDENGYEPVSKAALEEEYEQEEAQAASWQPPSNKRQPPANSTEFEQRVAWYRNQLKNSKNNSFEVPGQTNVRFSGNSGFNVICEINPNEFGKPQVCGDWYQSTMARRLQPSITDRQIAEFALYINNEVIISRQTQMFCTQYICINRYDRTVAGAVQPAMWQWMQENCNIFTDGTYSC